MTGAGHDGATADLWGEARRIWLAESASQAGDPLGALNCRRSRLRRAS